MPPNNRGTRGGVRVRDDGWVSRAARVTRHVLPLEAREHPWFLVVFDIMKNPVATCAYCGATSDSLTRDHVVPRALWKDASLPPNPVLRPQCDTCKSYWDAETTYFRNLLIVQSAPESHPAIMRLATGAVKRSIERSRPDFADLTRNAVDGWKRTDSGIYVERGVKIQIDLRRFHRTPEKIIRGLFDLRNEIVVPKNYDVRVFPGNSFWQDDVFNNLLPAMHDWQGLGDDVFQMRATRDINDPNFTAWLLVFYRSSAFFGYTCLKTYGDAAEPKDAGERG